MIDQQNRVDILEYISNWDNNIPISCVNMGCLNNKYDRAIQWITIECLRYALTEKIHFTDDLSKDYSLFARKTDKLGNKIADSYNFSGSQWNSGVHSSYIILRYGLKNMLNKANEEIPQRVVFWTNPFTISAPNKI